MKELKLATHEPVAGQDMGSAPAIAVIVDAPAPGLLLVKIGTEKPRKARMAASLGHFKPETLLGREVVLVFENNDPKKPIALALLQDSRGFAAALLNAAQEQPALEARVDDEHVVIQAKKKLELRVGKASIVIDENGKITIRGAQLLNRATGGIRIKGGHVEIN